MIQPEALAPYRRIQSIAKTVMNELASYIREGISEAQIAEQAENLMKIKGVEQFWYYGIGAFVHVGTRTTLSESGKHYKPSDRKVERQDVVTVDLSPELPPYWGDYARTFRVKDGKACLDDEGCPGGADGSDQDLCEGILMEQTLHRLFGEYVRPDRTFEEVYLYLNEAIERNGFQNLDFAGNLGHTIEVHKENRRYFERGNKMKLADAGLFTFEPHIKKAGGVYGFKREDIYYLEQGKLHIL